MNINLTIPDSLESVTIGQYQALTRLDKQRETMTTMQYVVECLKLFTPEKQRRDLVYVTPRYLLDAFNQVMDVFKKSSTDLALRTEIELNGTTYAINPNLSECSTIEYCEAVEVAKQGDDSLHLLMQIFFRPITKRNGNEYKIEPYSYSEERAKLFQEKMDMATVYSVQAFFLTILATYTEETNECLKQFPDQKHTMN